MDNIKEKLDAARENIKKAEAEQLNLYNEILDHYNECPEGIEEWKWRFMKEDVEDGRKYQTPTSNTKTFNHILWDFEGNDDFLTKSTGEQGIFVSVRPVEDQYEKKTYLGFLLGDLKVPSLSYDAKNSTLIVGAGSGNPAIWVFDLNKIIMGYASWWGPIKSEDDLRKITDHDIENLWYVKALKSLEKKGTNGP